MRHPLTKQYQSKIDQIVRSNDEDKKGLLEIYGKVKKNNEQCVYVNTLNNFKYPKRSSPFENFIRSISRVNEKGAVAKQKKGAVAK